MVNIISRFVFLQAIANYLSVPYIRDVEEELDKLVCMTSGFKVVPFTKLKTINGRKPDSSAVIGNRRVSLQK